MEHIENLIYDYVTYFTFTIQCYTHTIYLMGILGPNIPFLLGTGKYQKEMIPWKERTLNI